MDNEDIIVTEPEESPAPDSVADEVAKIKHALSEAQQYAFSKMIESKRKRENQPKDNAAEDNIAPVGDTAPVEAAPAKESAFERELNITREARMLEGSGMPYSIALKVAEATHAGDYELAGRILQSHENNMRIANADVIAEEERDAEIRKYFGLPAAAPKKEETEADKLRRLFGLR